MTAHNDLAHTLILRAARSAPPALAQRLEEEWLADLADRAGTFSRLRLAVGCYWATAVITRDFAMPQVAVSGVGGGMRALLDGAHHGFPQLSRRTVAFLMIAVVHLLLIYALATGMAQHFTPSSTTATQASVIQEIRHRDPPLPLPTYTPKDPTLVVPDIPIPIIDNLPDDTSHQTHVKDDGGDVTPETTPAPPAIHTLVGGPGKGFPDTEDFYPPTSRRLNESGAITVQVCVDPQGRLAADPVVTQSSGIPRLDEGALNLARAGSGHYRPSTENSRPVDSCFAYRIRFRLH